MSNTTIDEVLYEFSAAEANNNEPAVTDKYNNIPTVESFFLERALYNKVLFRYGTTMGMQKIYNYQGTLDTFCPSCDENATFSRSNYVSSERIGYMANIINRTHLIRFQCTRVCDQLLSFYVKGQKEQAEVIVDDETEPTASFEKVGQHPSTFTLKSPELKKYKKVLPTDKHDELVKSFELYTHNYGAPSNIYLRRILDYLFGEAVELKASQDPDFDDELYKKSKTKDRFKMIVDVLPQFLQDNNPEIYSLLSDGAHTKPDAECLEHYPILYGAIKVILTQKISEMEQADVEKSTTAELSKLLRESKEKDKE